MLPALRSWAQSHLEVWDRMITMKYKSLIILFLGGAAAAAAPAAGGAAPAAAAAAAPPPKVAQSSKCWQIIMSIRLKVTERM